MTHTTPALLVITGFAGLLLGAVLAWAAARRRARRTARLISRSRS